MWWAFLQTMATRRSPPRALEFFTGYLLEKSPAVDNIFVFLMIFSYCGAAGLPERVLMIERKSARSCCAR